MTRADRALASLAALRACAPPTAYHADTHEADVREYVCEAAVELAGRRYPLELDSALHRLASQIRRRDQLGAALTCERIARDAPSGLRSLLLDLADTLAPGPVARHDDDCGVGS